MTLPEQDYAETDPPADRGPEFDGVQIGRPATGALVDAGFSCIADLPEDLEQLRILHGVGPKAIRLIRDARQPQA